MLTNMITDECLEEAQITGKRPALCEADSVFNRMRKRCLECQRTSVGDETRAGVLYYSNTGTDLKPYLDYCEGQGFPDLVSPGSTGLVSEVTVTKLLMVSTGSSEEPTVSTASSGPKHNSTVVASKYLSRPKSDAPSGSAPRSESPATTHPTSSSAAESPETTYPTSSAAESSETTRSTPSLTYPPSPPSGTSRSTSAPLTESSKSRRSRSSGSTSTQPTSKTTPQSAPTPSSEPALSSNYTSTTQRPSSPKESKPTLGKSTSLIPTSQSVAVR